MDKKRFTIPLVFLTTASPQGEGGHSLGGEMSIKPVPCKFEEWLQSRWIGDYDNNDTLDFNDYAVWWAQHNFGAATWSEYNPSVAWNEDWLS